MGCTAERCRPLERVQIHERGAAPGELWLHSHSCQGNAPALLITGGRFERCVGSAAASIGTSAAAAAAAATAATAVLKAASIREDAAVELGGVSDRAHDGAWHAEGGKEGARGGAEAGSAERMPPGGGRRFVCGKRRRRRARVRRRRRKLSAELSAAAAAGRDRRDRRRGASVTSGVVTSGVVTSGVVTSGARRRRDRTIVRADGRRRNAPTAAIPFGQHELLTQGGNLSREPVEELHAHLRRLGAVRRRILHTLCTHTEPEGRE